MVYADISFRSGLAMVRMSVSVDSGPSTALSTSRIGGVAEP